MAVGFAHTFLRLQALIAANLVKDMLLSMVPVFYPFKLRGVRGTSQQTFLEYRAPGERQGLFNNLNGSSKRSEGAKYVCNHNGLARPGSCP